MADEQGEVRAIQELKARYFRFMDTRDFASWRTVFTDDLTVRVDLNAPSPGRPALTSAYPDGGDAFVAHMSAYFTAEQTTTVHHGHMPEITLTGPNTATGIWSMEDIVSWPDGRVMHGFGHYHEVYRKEGGQWRIAKLRLTRLKVTNSGPWPEAAAGDDKAFSLVEMTSLHG